MARCAVPERCEGCIFRPFINQHTDHGQFTVGSFVHEMHLCGILLAINPMFAGRVKMKLQQLERLVGCIERIA